MAKARLLVKRLKAVKNTKKITRTMELVATAKFKKAMDRATEAAAYTKKLTEIVADLSASGAEVSHPLLEKPEAGRHVLLVLTSNRGFCGGYNAAILRRALVARREGKAAGRQPEMEVSGKRGLAFMKFEGYDVAAEYTHFEDRPTFDEVDELASRYAAEFIDGKLGRLDVAWMKFLSPARQEAVVETLLPIGELDAGNSAGGPSVDYEFVPSAEEILSEIVPAAFKAQLFKCFLDAAVSEQIARRVAMKAATENADEMARDLSMLYNRARQSQITSELAEIIGGAAALE